MRLAFVLYRYFPYGGLQRDALRIARACAARGHAVRFLVLDWDGPEGPFPVHRVPARGLTRTARNTALAHAAQALRGQADIDGVIGFNKLPGLDVYYAADDCYRARGWSAWRRLTPRARQFLAHEGAVFAEPGNTLALCLTHAQAGAYRHAWRTAPQRLAVLPPSVPAPGTPEPAARSALRAALRVPGDARVVLFVGSDYARKGLDRAIAALAALPGALRGTAHLVVAGADRAQPYRRLARQLGVGAQVHLLGARDDVARLMHGADLLVHPARREAAGLVLLEALAAGLPVLTTDVCGYAPCVAQSRAGQVLRAPYDARIAAAALAAMLTRARRAQWAATARAWAGRAAATDFAGVAAQHIERHLARGRA